MQANSSLLNLMRLTSASLPIGAFAYSQGLEYVCDKEYVNDEKSTQEWIVGLLCNTQTYLDVPVLVRLYDAWGSNSIEQVEYWSKFLLAYRESKELREEDCYLGKALSKLLFDLEVPGAKQITEMHSVTYVTAFSLAAYAWKIEKSECCSGYLWAWCENQVNAAIKLIPLGQTAGQRILSSLVDAIPSQVKIALQLEDDEIGSTAVGLGIASANHETQYSRLFRS